MQGILNSGGWHDAGSVAIVEPNEYLWETYLPRNCDPLIWW